MNISQRGSGNTNLLREIQQASKKVSQETGLAEAMKIYPDPVKVDESKLGAAASLGLNKRARISEDAQKMLQGMFSSPVSGSRIKESGITGDSGNIKFSFAKSSLNRLIDDIELLSNTKEYFNALQSLISLYAMGYLDSAVLDKIPREDLNEIRGILREFKAILDEY